MLKSLLALTLICGAAVAQNATDKETAAALASEAKTRADAAKQAAKAKEPETRSAAVAACGDVAHPLTAAAATPFLADPDDGVRTEAAKALGKMTGLAEAAKALHAGLKPNEERPKVLQAVFTAIADVNHPSSVAACRDWINDRMSKRDTSDQPSINYAIEALGGLKWKSSVTTLIDLGKKNIVANGARGGHGMRWRSDVRFNRALKQLTGEEYESIDGWDDWWKKNAGKFNEDMTAR